MIHALFFRWHWQRARQAISRRDWDAANAHLAACARHLDVVGSAVES